VKSLFFLANSPLSYYGLLPSQMSFGSSLVLMSHQALPDQVHLSTVLFRSVLLFLTGLGLVMLAMHLGVMGYNRVILRGIGDLDPSLPTVCPDELALLQPNLQDVRESS
jgi:hypothetical protein